MALEGSYCVSLSEQAVAVSAGLAFIGFQKYVRIRG
jgi:hypothetical protein